MINVVPNDPDFSSMENAAAQEGQGRSAAPTLDWEAALAELQDQIDALTTRLEMVEDRVGEADGSPSAGDP